MTGPALACLLVLAAAGPLRAQEVREDDVSLQVVVEAGDARFGDPFPVTVVRSWRRDLRPEEWNEALLSPIELRLLDGTRSEEGDRTVERLRYEGRVFRTGEVTVPSPFFRARSPDGSQHLAFADEIELRVASSLPEGDAGTMELPTGPLPAPLPWRRWALLGLAASAGAAALSWSSRRRRGAAADDAPPAEAPHLRALQRLERLRERTPEGREQMRADSVEIAALVREFLEARFAVAMAARTSEELLDAPETARVLPPSQRQVLAGVLGHCDMVKFACRSHAQAERERWLARVEAFVRECSPAAETQGREAGENGSP